METHILCGFCNAPWTDEMVLGLESFSEKCASCGYGQTATIMCEIMCQSCHRVIYRKDGVEVV